MNKINDTICVSNRTGQETRIRLLIGIQLIFIFALGAVIFSLPGFGGYGNDVVYHMMRITGTADNISSATLFNPIYSVFFEGFGYGSSFFYCDFFLSVPALIYLAGFSIIDTYEIYCAILVLAVTLSTYFSFKSITSSRKTALLGTYFLCLSQYYLCDLYARSALGEYSAFIFLPVVLAGLYDLLFKDFSRPWLFGIGFGGLLLTHIISLELGIFFTALIIVVHIRRITGKGKWPIFKRLILTSLITLLATSFYWVSLIEQFAAQKLSLSLPGNTVPIGKYTQNWKEFFSLFGFFHPNNDASIGIGIPLLIVLLIRFYFFRKKFSRADESILWGVGICILTMGWFPWSTLQNTLLNIQFTYRLIPWAMMFLSIGAAQNIKFMFSSAKSQNYVITACIFLSILSGMIQVNYSINHVKDILCSNDIFTVLPEITYLIGIPQWLPVDADISSLPDNNAVFSSNNYAITADRDKNSISFTVTDSKRDAFEVPLLFYSGYRAEITDDEGTKTDLDVAKSDDGLLLLNKESGLKGRIFVWFAGTTLRWISIIVSFAAWISLAVYAVLQKKQSKSEKSCQDSIAFH